MTFSQNFACPDCGISIDEVQPRSFLLIILLGLVLTVMVWDTRWNLTKTLLFLIRV